MAKGKDIKIPSHRGGSKSGEKPTVDKSGKLTEKGNVGHITGTKR